MFIIAPSPVQCIWETLKLSPLQTCPEPPPCQRTHVTETIQRQITFSIQGARTPIGTSKRQRASRAPADAGAHEALCLLQMAGILAVLAVKGSSLVCPRPTCQCNKMHQRFLLVLGYACILAIDVGNKCNLDAATQERATGPTLCMLPPAP